MLQIKNLKVKVADKIVLNDINLHFQSGHVYAIMGRNGSGKSTLAKVIAGHPDYEVLNGEILLEHDGKIINILELEPHERVWHGLFMSYQSPVEVPGLENYSFLKTAYNSLLKFQGKQELDSFDFKELLQEKLKQIQLNENFTQRHLNVGFSGGEKKRNELLQLSLLEPKLAILDEIDSGLDIDATRIVMNQIKNLKKSSNTFIFITHYAKVISYIKPEYIYVIHNGQIILGSEDPELANKIEEQGFEFLIKEQDV